MSLLAAVLVFLRFLCVGSAGILAENLALRQQLALLERSVPRPKLRRRERLFWVRLSRWFPDWGSWLCIVKPETVVRWHRRGFRWFWWWKSRHKSPGRSALPANVIALIKLMARDNSTWGSPRIRAEQALLGHDVAESTVAKYIPRQRKPPSQSWRTFLANHVKCLASIDLFVVPTLTFRLLYGFVVLRHDRREIVHCNVTAHPTQEWIALQLKQAFPFDSAPRYLIRDRDSVYGEKVRSCLESLGIEEVLTAARSPWQNPFVERLIGTLRRELLNQVIVFNERHLVGLLKANFHYYHTARTHRSLEDNAPVPRAVEAPEQGEVKAIPYLGGLYHRYTRAA